MKIRLVLVWILMFAFMSLAYAGDKKEKTFTNSIGMKFVRIEPGTFKMGQLKTPLPLEIIPRTGGRGNRIDDLLKGDFDEKPVRTVEISKPFYMAVFEVTNLQYELFAPGHKVFKSRFNKCEIFRKTRTIWRDYEAINECSFQSIKIFPGFQLLPEVRALRIIDTFDYKTAQTVSQGFFSV